MKVPNRRELNTDVPFAPRGYENVNPDANAFGAMNANALASVAYGTAEIVNASIAIKEQNDEMRLLDFSNKINDLRTKILYDKENGYLNMKGENAAGKTDEVMTNFMSSADDILQNSKFFGTSKMKAANFVKKVGTNLFENVNAHDIQQTSVRDKVIFEKCNTTQLNTLLENRNDPQAFNNYLANMTTASDIFARSQGLDDNQKSALINASEANGVKTLLDSYLADNNMKSFLEVFNKYSDKLSPDVQTDYQAKITQYEFRNKVVETADSIMTSCTTEADRFKAIDKIKDIDLQDNVRQRVKSLAADENRIKNEQMRYQARSFAENIISLTPESAYRQINAIEDIDLRNYVMNEYNFLKSQQTELQNKKDVEISEQIMEKVYYAFDSGEDVQIIIKDIVASDLSFETKDKLINRVEKMREFKTAGNGWFDYNYLLDLAVTDNEQFVKENLATYDLTQSQYNQLCEMKRNAKNTEYSSTSQILKAVSKFDTAFNVLAKQGGLSEKVYKNDLVKMIEKMERLQGKAFDLNHLDRGAIANLIEGFGYKDKNAKDTIDETKELYMRAKIRGIGNIYDIVARDYVNFKGRENREPKPEEIHDMVKSAYNKVEREYKEKQHGKLEYATKLYSSVTNTIPKYGETRVLTYFADTEVKKIEKDLGIKITSVNGSRYRAGAGSHHSEGICLDISTSEHSANDINRLCQTLLGHPLVSKVCASNDFLVNRYGKNGSAPHEKFYSLQQYDTDYRKKHPNTNMNHSNHFHIVLDTRYGGTQQGKVNLANKTK